MLTQRNLNAARKRRIPCHLWSSSPTGFGARVLSSGAASFIFSFRAGSGRHARKRTLTVGSANNLAVEEAKAIAKAHAAAVAAGRDPAAERDEARARLAAAKAETIGILVLAFVQKHHIARGNRQAREVLRTLNADAVRRWGHRPVAEITAVDVTRLLHEVTERGSPGQSRRLHIALSGFFKWCLANHLIPSSPMGVVAKPSPSPARARDRVLSDEEIGLLWQVCNAVNPGYSACIRLILLTGCRRNEAAQAKWTEFDLDAGIWSLPATRSKNKRAHTTHLPVQAIELLRALPRSGEFVFSTTGGTKPLGGFSKVRRTLQAAMVQEAANLRLTLPVDDWVFHDVRRSLVSWLAGNGVAVHVADRLLNHVSGSLGGVLGIYQRYQFVPERRAALAAWGNHVASLATGTPAPKNIVPLHAAA